MTCFLFTPHSTQRLGALPSALPAEGFVWWVTSRSELELGWAELQSKLQALGLPAPMELHQHDLLNPQHPSHYDYTSDYDVVIFRRLVRSQPAASPVHAPSAAALRKQKALAILEHIVTIPVGFLVYDRVLITVHSEQCATADDFTRRMGNEANSRRPSSPDDLMLRMVNAMVDSYLELRKTLSAQIDTWQTELLHPRTRHIDWRALLSARNDLHALEDLCDEQQDAIQEWLDTLQEQPYADNRAARSEREGLVARGRDVVEHIERVVHHVRRLEQSAETAVQIHFNAQSNRTNDIMRTLTAITAVFLPLNLITGFFGMNFEFMPIVHNEAGLWWALGAMLVVAVTLITVFWRKRYLARTGR